MIERLVARRLWSGPETARTIEPEGDANGGSLNGKDEKKGASKWGSRSTAVYTTSHHLLLPAHVNSTASKVVDWQIEHHKGFIPAFVSAIRYAPIHGQQDRWRVLRENMESGKSGLKKVHLVLGETDPIIVAEELVEDATAVLGEENVRVEIVRGVGHEVAISNADDVVRVTLEE